MNCINEKVLKKIEDEVDELYNVITTEILRSILSMRFSFEEDKPDQQPEEIKNINSKKKSFQKIKSSVKRYFNNEIQLLDENKKIYLSSLSEEINSAIWDSVVYDYMKIVDDKLSELMDCIRQWVKYEKVMKNNHIDFYVDIDEFVNIIMIVERSGLSLNEQLSSMIYFVEKILETNKLYDKDATEFELCLMEIKEHYIDKNDSYCEDDIKILVENLENIGFNPKLCYQIGIELLNKITKKEIKINMDFAIKKVDYKEIEKELNTYIDFRNMYITRLLSVREIIKVVSLLMKINTDKDEIRRFLDNAYIEINKLNPVALYIQSRDKLKYYEEKYGIKEEMDILDDYFESLMICDEEEYNFFKNCLNEDLRKVLRYFPKSYDYEIEEAKKIS